LHSIILHDQGAYPMPACASKCGQVSALALLVRSDGRWTLVFLLALAVCVAGCSWSGAPVNTYAVKGRVLLANGKPLTAGRVTLIASDDLRPPASGEIGPDGVFTLSTRDPGDGAAPGQYKVRIEPVQSDAAARRARRPNFPLRYIDEDSSGLVVTIRAEPNQLAPIMLK
jgi:hypothetical protein